MLKPVPKPRIEVVIVAFNSEGVLAQCLEALPAAAGDCVIRVTVVDNASDTDVSSIVAKANSNAMVMRLPKNTGYAAGNNVAIRRVLAAGADPGAILILNPDVCLPPRSLERLLCSLNSAANCGAISPDVSDGAGVRFARMRPLWGLAARNPVNSKGAVSVDRLPGCCMLVRPAVFRRVGLFDEAYFLYWEEIDLCVRARKAGYELLMARDVTVLHGGDGDGLLKKHRAYYMWRNQVRFSLKNYGLAGGLIFLARRFLLANPREIVRYLARGQKSLALSGLAGLWAGVRGEVGPGRSRFAAPERAPGHQ
jgi:N-acetylglucosaminyl-diphospho-decaprenol L-rhamnosyltransferase